MTDQDPSFADARDELAEIVSRLETGELPLEESLALWQRAEALANICRDWLTRASERLSAVDEGFMGDSDAGTDAATNAGTYADDDD